MAGITFDSNFYGPSLFEPLKFYCILRSKYMSQKLFPFVEMAENMEVYPYTLNGTSMPVSAIALHLQ